MIAPNYVYLVATVLAFVATGTRIFAEGDVTVVPTSSSEAPPTQKTADSDGTPVVHKSLHKKKNSTASTTSTATAPATNAPAVAATHSPDPVTPPASHSQASVTVGPAPAPVPTTPQKPPPAISPTNIAVVKSIPIIAPAPTIIVPAANSSAPSPSIETGLPVAHYSGASTSIKGVSTYVPPPPVSIPPVKPSSGATTHQPYFASGIPSSVFSVTPVAAGASSFTAPSAPDVPSPSRTTKSAGSDFVFVPLGKKTKLFYPWKTGIITTMFWIGEGGSSISSTDNVASAWDEHWRTTNRGADTPNDRNGYAPSDHAATVNPFYVALPFNDLAFPDKARQYVPRSWRRPNQDGKPVSACKDRWVWIKASNGKSCFAQWEDVGPLRYDHAEYVFGNDRPDTYTRAGLDVSPAVAQYLGIDGGKRAITSWRFVDDEDVPPGQWLKYDEQAVLFIALHQNRTSPTPAPAPIQKAAEPIQDPDSVNSNKKKVGASKG